MKTLLREFWSSWETWVAIVGVVLTVSALVTLGSRLQQADYERRVDAAALKTVEQIRKEVDTLRIQNERSLEDRKVIKRQVEALKSELKEDRP